MTELIPAQPSRANGVATLNEMAKACAEVEANGFDPVVLVSRSKVPRDTDWPSKHYRPEDFSESVNLGVKLGVRGNRRKMSIAKQPWLPLSPQTFSRQRLLFTGVLVCPFPIPGTPSLTDQNPSF